LLQRERDQRLADLQSKGEQSPLLDFYLREKEDTQRH